VLAAVSVGVAAMTSLIPQAAAPAIPAMAQRFAGDGGGELFAKLAMTAPALSMIVCAPFAGMLADRFGHRLTLLVSLVLFLIGGAGVLFIDDGVSLIVLRLIVGIAGGGLFTVGLAMISENFAGQAREQLFGFVVLVASCLSAGSNMFGGALVDWFGWRAPFALYLIALPILVVAWRIVRDPFRVGRAARIAESKRVRLLTPMVPYYLLLILLTIGVFIPYIEGGLVLQERGVTSAAVRGGIISMTAFLSGSSGFLYS
jgi:MFS family permease